MSVTLAPAPIRNVDLATMSLADAPDLWTAIDAGIMHGLSPREAMRSAFHKWLGDNKDAVQQFGLVNFYEHGPLGPDTTKAFQNISALLQFAIITNVEQDRVINAQATMLASLAKEVGRLTAAVAQLPPESPTNG